MVESNNYFEIFDHFPIGIFIINRNFNVIYWNEILEEWTKIDKKDIINKDIRLFFPNFNEKINELRLKDIFLGGPPLLLSSYFHNYIIEIPTYNGKLRVQQTTVSAIQSQDATEFYALISIQDTTDLTNKIFDYRKERDKAIEGEAKIRAVFNNVLDAIITINDNGIIEEVNESIENIFGYKPEELIGKNISILMPEPHKSSHNQYLANYLNTGIKKVIGQKKELIAVKKNGEIFPIELGVTEVQVKNKILFSGIIRDITERKKTEEEIIKSKEIAISSNKMKSEFLANISHELRTPMNAVIGISKMLLKYNSENLTNKQKEGLGLVYQSGERLLNLINDILDLSKVESGKMSVKITEFNLNDLLNNLINLVKNLILTKDIQFFIEKSLDIPDIINSDFDKLNQILLNILGNSVKFTEKGKIILKIHQNQNKLYFEIKDTGIGIEKKNIHYIFEAFRQIDSSDTKKYKGTGLGLTIVKKFINLLNGEIKVESEIGVGTTVKFFIPINCETCKTQSKVTISNDNYSENINIDKKNKKILIAEDEYVGQITIGMMLENYYNLIFAKDGVEVIEKFLREKPDMILMDIMMPKMSGFDAFTLIRKIEEGKNIPIIAVTAKAMKEEKEKIIEFGFNDYISKPIDDELLIRLIKKYL
ncbi:MAG: hypothetical protein A2086_05630 [Spirochaetes bacterium GWD1_27_9]|nr:MAG: hypothetical protein A2Z98_06730 [Spirochaetes bacterium GWB1_27_13]OHD26176.1 MAG: hypothetical protein A2Y34_08735 [Spirochaetes bacterium GWC1_27_15]OHD37620.1 MAG: hypothetical protein A2086_05630 [Spirochaetes bacterium GWD1_27_9]